MAGSASGKTWWAWIVGTFFGVGRLKPGPGTYGSLAAVLLWMAVAQVPGLGRSELAVITGVAALIATVVGIRAATIVARESGREDPGFVVVDEVAGQWVALIAIRPDIKHAIFGLVLFRLFDIWKPWPVSQLEELPGGTGIMLDDVAAGALALMIGLLVGLHA